MVFIEYLLCSRHHARGFTCFLSFNPVKEVAVISPTAWVRKQLGEVKSPNVTQLVSSLVRTPAHGM